MAIGASDACGHFNSLSLRPSLTPTELDSLRTECLRNEAELERLRDLPVSEKDPATREDELEKRQDQIEFLLGRAQIERRRHPSSE